MQKFANSTVAVLRLRLSATAHACCVDLWRLWPPVTLYAVTIFFRFLLDLSLYQQHIERLLLWLQTRDIAVCTVPLQHFCDSATLIPACVIIIIVIVIIRLLVWFISTIAKQLNFLALDPAKEFCYKSKTRSFWSCFCILITLYILLVTVQSPTLYTYYKYRAGVPTTFLNVVLCETSAFLVFSIFFNL